MTSEESGAIFEYKVGHKRKSFLIPTESPGYEAIHNYVSVRTGFTDPHFFLQCDASKCFLKKQEDSSTTPMQFFFWRNYTTTDGMPQSETKKTRPGCVKKKVKKNPLFFFVCPQSEPWLH